MARRELSPTTLPTDPIWTPTVTNCRRSSMPCVHVRAFAWASSLSVFSLSRSHVLTRALSHSRLGVSPPPLPPPWGRKRTRSAGLCGRGGGGGPSAGALPRGQQLPTAGGQRICEGTWTWRTTTSLVCPRLARRTRRWAFCAPGGCRRHAGHMSPVLFRRWAALPRSVVRPTLLACPLCAVLCAGLIMIKAPA